MASDPPMTPHRITLALVLVMVAVLLAAGCAAECPVDILPVNSTTTVASPVPTVITKAPVTPVRTICPVSENKSSWITITPIDRIERGEAIRISGTTNVPAGKHLSMHIYPGFFHPHCRCCYDDEMAADVIVRYDGECANTFSFLFDTTNFVPAEYIVTVMCPENSTESNTLIFTILENITPLSVPTGNLSATIPAGTLLAAFQPRDVTRGDIQTITGIINGTPYAVEYSIRDTALETVCRPECPGENYHGIIHAQESVNGKNRFALRFDTGDMKPGSYVADLKLTCIVTDSPVMVRFNITQNTTGAVL
jgi:hypothetical protein